MGMRLPVAAAWPAFCTRWEGRCWWMYLDVKLKVTTGTGNLIDSIAAAQELPWLTKSDQPASPSQIATEWRRVKALASLAKQGGYAYRASAQLHLTEATLDKLLATKTAEFWARLKQTVTTIEDAPADAQLALLDEAWQNGPAFLDLREPDGSYTWTNTRAAVLAGDWAAAARAVPDPHPDPGDDDQHDRAEARKRLFRNAATAVAFGADPNILWLDRPVEPPTPDLEDEIMTMTPAQRAQFVDEIATRVVTRLLYTDAIPAPSESDSNPTWKGISYWQNWTKSLDAIKAKLGI